MFQVVAASGDHPSADEIFERTRRRLPEISFATVYNCLGVLVECGLVRQVTVDRAPARFCPNMREHCHFLCERCGEITDIAVASGAVPPGVSLPRGFEVGSCEISLRGVCQDCRGKTRRARSGGKHSA